MWFVLLLVCWVTARGGSLFEFNSPKCLISEFFDRDAFSKVCLVSTSTMVEKSNPWWIIILLINRGCRDNHMQYPGLEDVKRDVESC